MSSPDQPAQPLEAEPHVHRLERHLRRLPLSNHDALLSADTTSRKTSRGRRRAAGSGDEAKAFIVAGEQFIVACYGSAPATCDSQRAHWQTTNWTAGWNRYPGNVWVSGQLPVAQSGVPLFVRGSFTAGNACRYVVTNPDGALVSTNNVIAPVNGTQTLNLGNPVVPGAHALSVICNLSQDRTIGAAWQ